MSRFTSGFEGMHTVKGVHSSSRRAHRNPIMKSEGVSKKTRSLVLTMAKQAGLNRDQMQELASTMRGSGMGARTTASAAPAARAATMKERHAVSQAASRPGYGEGHAARQRQARVKAPRVGRGQPRRGGGPTPYYRPMRKPAQAIAADLAEIEEAQRAQARSMQAPFATRHIPQSQKTVLQDAYLENIPKPKARTKPAAGVGASKNAASMDAHELFEAISSEIQERQETLEKLRALGQSEAHEAKLMGEISQRVAELKRLNQIMQ